MNDREAYIVLNMISGVGTARFRALLSEFGTAAAIFNQSASRLAAIKGISLALAERIINWQSEVDLADELDTAARGGVEIITLGEDNYPELLKGIYDPPLCLYVRGQLPDFAAPTVAVIGSRRMTAYGKKMARHFSEAAVFAGWKVVSGLAYGVDAVAHEVTVNAGGVTVAVLGGGLTRVHPQDHVPLARSIINSGGALISEFPMRYPVSRQSFPRRNRIVSGLSHAVVVIEAGIGSGALITAELALDQGKAVFALPGHIDNPQAKGCHKLIKEGAAGLLDDFADVMREFEFLPGFGSTVQADQTANAIDFSTAGLTNEELQIVKLLELEPKSFEKLVNEAALPAEKLSGMLTKLELMMILNRQPGEIYSLR
ncbi:DNA-processing protein DprA [Lentisphaerota bacterium ZTH]|nr:DNA-processing protein DprA [Lentisphaerota bacterium]WET07292.1 DNA-processing protein DprA [Lentisphaerota bacterium ZTH]